MGTEQVWILCYDLIRLLSVANKQIIQILRSPHSRLFASGYIHNHCILSSGEYLRYHQGSDCAIFKLKQDCGLILCINRYIHIGRICRSCPKVSTFPIGFFRTGYTVLKEAQTRRTLVPDINSAKSIQ